MTTDAELIAYALRYLADDCADHRPKTATRMRDIATSVDNGEDTCDESLTPDGPRCSLPKGHDGLHVPLAVLWQEAGYTDGPWRGPRLVDART